MNRKLEELKIKSPIKKKDSYESSSFEELNPWEELQEEIDTPLLNGKL